MCRTLRREILSSNRSHSSEYQRAKKIHRIEGRSLLEHHLHKQSTRAQWNWKQHTILCKNAERMTCYCSRSIVCTLEQINERRKCVRLANSLSRIILGAQLGWVKWNASKRTRFTKISRASSALLLTWLSLLLTIGIIASSWRILTLASSGWTFS